MAGKFITFEGGEGAGKSTQVKLLAEFLRARGEEVVTTREPGGTKAAEQIRSLLLTAETKYPPFSEVLLNFAARFDHVKNIIRPALDAGKWVLCDRFYDSTTAYQGYGQGVDLQLIDDVRRASLGGFAPDITFILDIDEQAALERAKARGETNRFEEMGQEFHQKIRTAFREIAKNNPQRCIVIDASGTPQEIQTKIQTEIRSKI